MKKIKKIKKIKKKKKEHSIKNNKKNEENEKNKEKKENKGGKENKINNYLPDLCKEIFSDSISFILLIIINIYNICEIIIHQILLYRTIGGIINIIGQYGYNDTVSFFSGTSFGQAGMIFTINFCISCLILYVLSLIINDKKIFLSSQIGFAIMLFIFFVIFFQFIFYFINYYLNNFNINELNIYPTRRIFTRQLKISQSFAILSYCYWGNYGFFLKNEILKKSKKNIRDKSFILSNILKGIVYLFFSCGIYLSVPDNVVDIAIERKNYWAKDLNMTISRILLIPLCLSKIQINLYFLRDNIFSCIQKNDDNISINKLRNFVFSFITLSITTFFSSLYQNITGYITLIGGFSASFLIYLFPPMMNYYCCKENYRKNLIKLLIGIICSCIGFIGGICGLIDLIKGNYNFKVNI